MAQQPIKREFRIHCLSKTKTLKKKEHRSIEELKKDIFTLYSEWKFDDDNAILTNYDVEDKPTLLISMSDLPKTDIYIKFVCIYFIASK